MGEIEDVKQKAIAMINSCETPEHLENTFNFIELFLTQYKDDENYNELKLLLNNKKIELGFY